MPGTGQGEQGAQEQPEFDGRCGLAAAFGREEAGDRRWRRVIDGRTVQFHSRAVRLTSLLFTGRIRRAVAADHE